MKCDISLESGSSESSIVDENVKFNVISRAIDRNLNHVVESIVMSFIEVDVANVVEVIAKCAEIVTSTTWRSSCYPTQ